MPATDQVHRPRASNLPLLLPHTYEKAGEGDEVQIPGSPSPSRMGQRYTDRWERMPAIECSWAVARGSVGHVPVPASGALAPIGVALAMATWEGRCNSPLVRSAGSVEACEARETGGWRTGADGGAGAETPA